MPMTSASLPPAAPVSIEQPGAATLLAADRSAMSDPGAPGRFGNFGGRYVPEAPIPARGCGGRGGALPRGPCRPQLRERAGPDAAGLCRPPDAGDAGHQAVAGA